MPRSKQKTAYEMSLCDWSSDVCSSDLGIGNESFSYLRKLDNLSGRQSDNTGFTAVKDMNRMSDTELYNELLRQYVDWLKKK